MVRDNLFGKFKVKKKYCNYYLEDLNIINNRHILLEG